MGVFSGIGNAKVSRDANYFRPGHFWLRIDSCRIGENRHKDKLSFIEGTVVAVLDDPAQHEDPHRVGEVTTKATKVSSDYFLPDTLQFISAAAGVDLESASDEDKEEAANLVFGDQNPLAGTCVEVRNRGIITQTGNPFTKVTFVREVLPAELLEALDEEVIARFWPGDALQRVIEAEKQSA
jgi:hypothetical protein